MDHAYALARTLSIESNAVTMPSTTGKEPWVSTGEWRPVAFVLAIETIVVGTALPSLMVQMVSPTRTSLVSLRVAQHSDPTGRW